MFKKGDKVRIVNEESSFGIVEGRYVKYSIPGMYGETGFTVVDTGIEVKRNPYVRLTDPKTTDLLIKDEKENYFFVSSKTVESVNPEIALRYLSNNKDVTEELSDESKRAVRKAND